MIVERWTWQAKVGCRDEVVKLVKAMVEEAGLTPRVCTYVYGPFQVVTSDLEFETMEDQKRFGDELDHSQPAFVEFHKKYADLVELTISREVLQVH